MKKSFAWVGIVMGTLTTIVLLFGLTVGSRWVSLQVEKWFAPREENVRREVFENTKSYNEGKEQELAKTYKEYMSATTEDERKGLRAYVTHTFADYPIERLDPALQNFVRECRGY
jgi:fructose-1,6-bisphosphatase